MPSKKDSLTRYAVMIVPLSGLFCKDGVIVNGAGVPVIISRDIHFFTTRILAMRYMRQLQKDQPLYGYTIVRFVPTGGV